MENLHSGVYIGPTQLLSFYQGMFEAEESRLELVSPIIIKTK